MSRIDSVIRRNPPGGLPRVSPIGSRGFRAALASAAFVWFTAPLLAQGGGGYEITRRSFTAPGTTFHAGGGYRLGSTIGRPDIGQAMGGGYELTGGFWTRETQPLIIEWDADDLSPLRGTRGLTFNVSPPAPAANVPPAQAAIAIELLDLQTPNPPNPPCCPAPSFGAYETATCSATGEAGGCIRWVGPPSIYLESQDNPGLGSYLGARLQCTPYYTDWTIWGEISVIGAEVMPSSLFGLRTVSSSCKGVEAGCPFRSERIEILTRRTGDIAMPFNPPAFSDQPDPVDVVSVLNKFKSLPGSPRKVSSQLQPNVVDPNQDVGALDIVATLDAFKGLAYAFTGPCPCPSTVSCGATPCSVSSDCSPGLCIKTCVGGPNAGLICNNNQQCNYCVGGAFDGLPCLPSAPMPCVSAGGTCPLTGTCPAGGFCRDRCGRCN